jgi:hypothetical protein
LANASRVIIGILVSLFLRFCNSFISNERR